VRGYGLPETGDRQSNNIPVTGRQLNHAGNIATTLIHASEIVAKVERGGTPC
jgi:hypothetical protein